MIMTRMFETSAKTPMLSAILKMKRFFPEQIEASLLISAAIWTLLSNPGILCAGSINLVYEAFGAFSWKPFGTLQEVLHHVILSQPTTHFLEAINGSIKNNLKEGVPDYQQKLDIWARLVGEYAWDWLIEGIGKRFREAIQIPQRDKLEAFGPDVAFGTPSIGMDRPTELARSGEVVADALLGFLQYLLAKPTPNRILDGFLNAIQSPVATQIESQYPRDPKYVLHNVFRDLRPLARMLASPPQLTNAEYLKIAPAATAFLHGYYAILEAIFPCLSAPPQPPSLSLPIDPAYTCQKKGPACILCPQLHGFIASPAHAVFTMTSLQGHKTHFHQVTSKLRGCADFNRRLPGGETPMSVSETERGDITITVTKNLLKSYVS